MPGLPTLSGYEFDRVLGAGSTGTVYLARQVSTDRPVAVKILAPSLVEAPGFRERFRAEARLMTRFDDENLVNIYDYVEPDDGAYLVMQYVPGAPLRSLMVVGDRFTPEQSLGVLSGALSGLSAAHRLGVVHGDLKPENILVSEQGVSKLVDFGQASPSGSRPSGGTPSYASPEALRDEPVDARSDVYAAGVILYELLAGHPLFEGTAAEVAAAHRDTEPPRLEEVCSNVSELVARSLSKSPEDRPGSAAEFLDELRNAAEHCYGASWELRAGIAGLVGAAVGGVAVGSAAAGMGGGAGGSAGGAPGGSTNATPSEGEPVRRPKLRTGVAVGLAALLCAGIGVGATAATGAFSASHHRGLANGGAPPGALAACLMGTWQSEGGQGDDEWNGVPVPVSSPKSPLNGTVRYSSDGTWQSIDPAGEPPSTGTFQGAPFVDQVYGEATGTWTTKGDHTLVINSVNYNNYAGILYAAYAHQTSSRVQIQSLSGATTSAEQVTCSGTTLTDYYTVNYQGKTLRSQSTLRRIPSGATVPNPAAVFPQADLLGGVGFDAYCQSTGASGATLTKPLTGPGSATDSWACIKGGSTTPVDMNAACQWQFYYHSAVTAQAVDPNAAFSWLCYGGPENSFTIQPTDAPAGSTVQLRSVTPCPVHQVNGQSIYSVGFSFGYFDRGTYNFIDGFGFGSGQALGSRGTLLPSGQWTIQLTLPALGVQTNAYYGGSGVDAGKQVDIVPGRYYYSASCSFGGNSSSANYRPQFLNLR